MLTKLCLAIERQIIGFRPEIFQDQPVGLNIVIKLVSCLNEVVSEFLILILVDIFSIFVPPEMQEVVSEQFKLTLQFFIVFSHGTNILFQSLNVGFLHLFKMKFENLHSELHFCIVVQLDAIELAFVDPSLQFINILRIKVRLPFEFILSHRAFYSQIQIWWHLLVRPGWWRLVTFSMCWINTLNTICDYD